MKKIFLLIALISSVSLAAKAEYIGTLDNGYTADYTNRETARFSYTPYSTTQYLVTLHQFVAPQTNTPVTVFEPAPNFLFKQECVNGPYLNCSFLAKPGSRLLAPGAHAVALPPIPTKKKSGNPDGLSPSAQVLGRQ